MAEEHEVKSAETVVDIFETEGIEYVFGLPGSQILDVVDGVDRRDGMEFVGTRHEQAAAFMAEGYARATRGPSVCLSTVGPGATNLITGVASAYKGYIPILALTGKHARWQQERNTFQEIDQKELFAPVTCYSRMATEPADLPKLTRKAFRLMSSNPRGPAHLNLPKDTQNGPIDAARQPHSAYHTVGAAEPATDAVKDVMNRIGDADRPVLLAGYNVVWEDATDELAVIAETLGVPVVTSCLHLDAFPTEHELAMGPIGPGFWKCANSVVNDADLVVAVGAHFDFLSTHFGNRIIPEGADTIQIHSDPANIGAVYPVEIGLSCDISHFLQKAINFADGTSIHWSREGLSERKQAWFDERAADVDMDKSPIHPATIVELVRETAPDNTRFTVDGGNFLKHVIRQLDTTASNTYIHNANFGTVGSAFPLALGAGLAIDEPIVCFTGDGGMALNVQELETAARENISVTIIVFNDYGMGNVRSYQKYVYEERYAGVDFAEQNFATIAEGFGVEGRHVKDPNAAAEAIREGIARDDPFVVDIETDAGALEPPVFMNND